MVITVDDTHETYTVSFFGDHIHTTVTHDPDVVSDWISDVESTNRYRRGQLVVGLDVEWRPSYNRIRNPVAILQLCVDRRCLIYQLFHSHGGVPTSLTRFLSRPDCICVGVGISSDLEKLQEDYGFGYDSVTEDLRNLVVEYGRRDLRNSGLKELASVLLGRDMEKPRRITMSSWDNRRLTREQVQYACVDAFVSSEIGRLLLGVQ